MTMMQQINLYHPPEEAPPPKLSFKLLTQISLGVLALLALVSVILFVMTYLTGSNLAQFKEDGKKLRTELIRVSKEMDIVSDESTINKEMAELQVVLSNKEKAIMILKGQGLDNTFGFSSYLEALSRRHIDNTWFTKIAIAHGGQNLDLEGETTTPDLIPAILEALGKEHAFDGRSFKVFNVVRHNANTVGFNIETGQQGQKR